MPEYDISPPVYRNEVERLLPFENQKAAETWLKENELDINGTPILIPYKNVKTGNIEFLKPSDERDHLRIMGAANRVKSKSWFKTSFNWIKETFTRDFAPHINHLVGNVINIEENGFIVVYERGEEPAGEAFATFFREEKKALKDEIKITQTNDGPKLNPAKFIERLSALALDLKIKAGMNYFIIRDDNGIPIVYRHTFHGDATNSKIADYLKAEAEQGQSQPIRVHNNKTNNNHFFAFLTDWGKWTVFAMGTAILAGFIASPFISPFIAGSIAIGIFVGLSFFGFYRASKDNPKTIEFGDPEFEELNTMSSFNKLKYDVRMVFAYLKGKLFQLIRNIKEVNSFELPNIANPPTKNLTSSFTPQHNKEVSAPNDTAFFEKSVLTHDTNGTNDLEKNSSTHFNFKPN